MAMNLSHNSLLCDSSTLSHNVSGVASFIYELPYNVRKELCDLLDADGSWRQLGGVYLGMNDTQLTLISHALFRGASPTNDLLTRWEASNPKVRQLFKYLAYMKHQRAMHVLKPYVESKLQVLCISVDNEDSDEALGAVGGTAMFNNNLFDPPPKTKFCKLRN